MMDIFSNKSMPFYRFSDTVFLEKIDSGNLISFIIEKFSSSGKEIDHSFAEKIVLEMENHPYYTQQLSFITWNNTETKVNERIFHKSRNDLIEQNSFIYEKDFDQLSNKQIQFLKLILDGVTEGFSSAAVINKYGLGNSAAVSKVIKALEVKEILKKRVGKIDFLDPVFKLWLKNII